MEIRRAVEADAEAVVEIYNPYILNTIVTFETQAVGLEEMRARIRQTLARHDWLVAEAGGRVFGYAYYAPFRTRAAYDHTVESTVYVAPDRHRRQAGEELYARLIDSARDRGFRELIGVVALPNPASTALHRKMGFVEAGVLKNVGYKFGRYLDVGLWQRSVFPSLQSSH